MRKFLDQNFWSHGTPLGSLVPLSQQDTILGAGQLQILVIWGPYRPPIVVALETQAENPKTAGLQCVQSYGIRSTQIQPFEGILLIKKYK